MPKPRARAAHEPVVPTTFSLPPAYVEAFDAEAAEREISRSELLRRLIERMGWIEPPPAPEPLAPRRPKETP